MRRGNAQWGTTSLERTIILFRVEVRKLGEETFRQGVYDGTPDNQKAVVSQDAPDGKSKRT